MTSVVVAGVGGQGTVLMSRLIGDAAIAQGHRVRGSETIGMAQRGGSVLGHVRFGGEIYSPITPLGGADLVIAFEPSEGVRAFPYLKPGGAIVVCDRAVQPTTGSYRAEPMLDYLRAQAAHLVPVNGEQIIARCGTARCLNVALLGVAVGAGLLPLSPRSLEQALAARVAPRFMQMNMDALNTGMQFAQEIQKTPCREDEHHDD